MRMFAIASASTLGLALSGCAAFESGITSLSNTINQPNVQQALATVKIVSTALVCDVSTGSALAKSIATAAGSHTGVVNEVDVVSTSVCKALQGSLVPNMTEANVPAVSAVSVPVAGRYRVIAR